MGTLAADALDVSTAAQIKTAQPTSADRKPWVLLRGTLEPAIQNERYILTDTTGEILVKIKDDIWRGLLLRSGEEALVEGELEFKGSGAEVNIMYIQRAGSGGDAGVTVSQIKQLPEKSWVVVRGTIVRNIEKDNYLFRDSTGDMVVKIKEHVWRGLPRGTGDPVEIRGDIKWEKKTIAAFVDAGYIGKIQP
ncbi:NirD/YgiW/YdeI family stress tolerance protein [Breznakiella homolactica]|uniref:NirD/YgiW/YdeI family stress tolerance protein n=1 Tax=Breznakiella homolactica TaxID=2798577 RepID=A0A7T7XR45_9SPIR|nr:NirD/YgiW/YdeI family stress tolerance protein [Breznakiella homolactica]QQO10962.1 NirD/YgiW/YdeI family stress tolerance protein [Breznakiella homolactica]